MKKIIVLIVLALSISGNYLFAQLQGEGALLNRTVWPYIRFIENGIDAARIQGNNGYFSVTSNNGGTPHFSVNTNSGSIGIGTISPNIWFQSHVFEFKNNRPVFSLNSTGSLGTIVFTNNKVNSANHEGEYHLNHYYIESDPTKSKLSFNAYPGGNVLTLRADGNVGINTDPYAKLHVINKENDSNGNTLILGPTATSNLRLGYHADYSWIQSHGGKPLRINELGNNTILNLNGGFVGIGTDSPFTRLQVVQNASDGDVSVSIMNSDESTSINETASIRFFLSNSSVDRAGYILSGREDGYSYDAQRDSYLAFGTTMNKINYERLRITSDGLVGIGTTNPSHKLDVNGTSGNVIVGVGDINATTSDKALLYLQANIDDNTTWLNSRHNIPLLFGVNNQEVARFNVNGSMQIGTLAPTTNDYKLAVDGTIRTKEVIVTTDNWADYVFASDYNLRTLTEVENFIAENAHLPDVPSEAKVKEEGISLGEMNAILLQKIEELTLYTIEQEKKIEKLEAMEMELEELKQLINQISK